MRTYPNLDPELATVAAALPDIDITDLAAARAQEDAAAESSAGVVHDVGIDVLDVTATGPAGAPDVPIRLLRPAGATGALPVLLALHGGGYVLGRAQDFDPFCAHVVHTLGIAVANVEYRRAPEAPFPSALDDCWAALHHLHAHGAELGVDPARIAVAGSSAGGGLAAATTLRARDEGGPPIVFQLLISPGLDDRAGTVSASGCLETPALTRQTVLHVWQYYLGPAYSGPDDPDVSPYAAPARATDLSGLPPAYIAAMELDPARDENIEYALRLLQAGVSVELHSHPGTFHGSIEFAPDAASTARILHGALDGLARGLHLRTAPSPSSY